MSNPLVKPLKQWDMYANALSDQNERNLLYTCYK